MAQGLMGSRVGVQEFGGLGVIIEGMEGCGMRVEVGVGLRGDV